MAHEYGVTSTSIWGDDQTQSTFTRPTSPSPPPSPMREQEYEMPSNPESADSPITAVPTMTTEAEDADTSNSIVPDSPINSERSATLLHEARTMQDGLAAILERILAVKSEYEKLENENKFLDDYFGKIMRKSNMLQK
ncbi:uncharacterized protein V1518DRAFT_404297 [Limtongia smithiae]|uniref:uncharacterized protein n=1 Tax=Limtongia smithiae TaxID=1125753 RepID=UPI0034CD5C84